MSALTIFKQFPKTRSEINDCVAALKAEMLSGEYDIIELDILLKKVEELSKGVREDKEVKAAVLSELEKYTEKTVERYGCNISKVSRSSWKYDLCNDIELQDLEQKKKEIDEQIKARQKVLQVMKKEQVIVTPDGSIETIYPASRTFTDTFSITIL